MPPHRPRSSEPPPGLPLQPFFLRPFPRLQPYSPAPAPPAGYLADARSYVLLRHFNILFQCQNYTQYYNVSPVNILPLTNSFTVILNSKSCPINFLAVIYFTTSQAIQKGNSDEYCPENIIIDLRCNCSGCFFFANRLCAAKLCIDLPRRRGNGASRPTASPQARIACRFFRISRKCDCAVTRPWAMRLG